MHDRPGTDPPVPATAPARAAPVGAWRVLLHGAAGVVLFVCAAPLPTVVAVAGLTLGLLSAGRASLRSRRPPLTPATHLLHTVPAVAAGAALPVAVLLAAGAINLDLLAAAWATPVVANGTGATVWHVVAAALRSRRSGPTTSPETLTREVPTMADDTAAQDDRTLLTPGAVLREIDPAWEVVDEHHLVRTFRFPDFAQALAFVNRVGAIAEDQDHHPELTLTWGKVRVAVHSHDVGGLTRRDVRFAGACDALPGNDRRDDDA